LDGDCASDHRLVQAPDRAKENEVRASSSGRMGCIILESATTRIQQDAIWQ
jgi:hypothetical protein